MMFFQMNHAFSSEYRKSLLEYGENQNRDFYHVFWRRLLNLYFNRSLFGVLFLLEDTQNSSGCRENYNKSIHTNTISEFTAKMMIAAYTVLNL